MSAIITAPEEIRGVSRSQFSVARHYGGCTFQRASYAYDPVRDVLIRRDVLARRQKEAKAAERYQRDLDSATEVMAAAMQGELI